MQLFVLLCIFVSAVTADQPWPNLKTTFGLNPLGNAFHSQPMTADEASDAGLHQNTYNDDTCVPAPGFQKKHLGIGYGDPEEQSLVIIYDVAGYIAGVQSVLIQSAVDLNYYDIPNIPAYTEGTYFRNASWMTTAYFVDPEIICNGGRTEEQFIAQGLGDRLWIQVGDTPDNFVKIPLTQAEADATDNWNKHLCFPGMGTHYMEFNYEIDQDCNSVFPIQILYDEGVITGFVWQHNANLPGKRWEKPNEMAINGIIDHPPQCTLDLSHTPGLSTMHHYFFNYPYLTNCF